MHRIYLSGNIHKQSFDTNWYLVKEGILVQTTAIVILYRNRESSILVVITMNEEETTDR